MPQPVGNGDALSDVIRYWSTQVLNPDEMVFQEWDTRPYLKINAGQSGIYFSFSRFVEDAFEISMRREQRMNDKGIDLQNRDGISFEEIMSDDVLSPSARPKSKVNIIPSAKFWSISSLVIDGIKCTTAHVIMPCRFAVSQCLKRLPGKIQLASLPLQTRLSQVRTAYANHEFHRLHLIVTSHMCRSQPPNPIKDDCAIAFYNVTENGGLLPSSKVEYVRLCDMKIIHPMFELECWKHMIFMVAGLANVCSLYIHFRFNAGLFHQYILIHDQNMEVKFESETPHGIGDVKSCIYTTLLSNTVEEKDYRDGAAPQWICDMDIPDKESELDEEGEHKPIRYYLPDYRGARLRLMFRQDYSSWFFPANENL